MLTPTEIERYSSREFLHDQFPCGLLSFQSDGAMISANKTLAEWSGVEIAELETKNFRTLLENSSMIYYDLIIEPLLRMKGMANEFSLKFRSATGHYDALFSARCYLDAKGNILLITASIQKIIDRKKYEAELLLERRLATEQAQFAQTEKRRFEFLFSSSPNIVWTIGPKGEILHMNKKASDFIETLPPSCGKIFYALAKPDRARAIAKWRKCHREEKKFEKELKLTVSESIPEWHLVTAEPYYNTDGVVEMWFCTATDIHRRKLLQLANQKELQSNLLSANRYLDEKSELLTEIAADQSHMVRKPLANILGLVSLLQGNAGSTDSQLLELLQQSAKELDQMIREVSTKTNMERNGK